MNATYYKSLMVRAGVPAALTALAAEEQCDDQVRESATLLLSESFAAGLQTREIRDEMWSFARPAAHLLLLC